MSHDRRSPHWAVRPPSRISRTACSLLIGAAACIAALPLRAQAITPASPSTAPQADSAGGARAAYRRAVAAYRQHDLPAARSEMRRAALLWPTQPAYLEAAAGLAVEANDTADAAAWIGRLATLGVGRDPAGDSSAAVLRRAPDVVAALARLREATRPLVRSRVRLTLADTLLHPEGLAFDPRSGQWFLGSVRERKIVAVDAAGVARDLVAPGARGLAGVFGMVVDSARGLLWAATSALPRMSGFQATDSGRAGVLAISIESGTVAREAWLSRDGREHILGDVAVASDGSVYTSDSMGPWIYRLDARGGALVPLLTHPLFRSLQGMALTPDGRTMYVADYSHGLLHIDLARRVVTPVAHAPEVTLLGIDGLYLHGGTLVAIQNGVVPARVVQVCLDPAGTRAMSLHVVDRNTDVADEPTLGTIVRDSLFYVATSAWEKFDDAGARTPGTVLRRPTVLGVALDATPCMTSTPPRE